MSFLLKSLQELSANFLRNFNTEGHESAKFLRTILADFQFLHFPKFSLLKIRKYFADLVKLKGLCIKSLQELSQGLSAKFFADFK